MMFVMLAIGFAVVFIGALFMAEATGRWLGRRAASRSAGEGAGPEEVHDRTGHVLTSTFGLLALLLGFSFGIVLNRYDARRADVVAEANAISTAHYHAGFAAEQGARLQQSLTAYARLRLDYGQAGQFERPRLERESSRLRDEIAATGRDLAPLATTPLGSMLLSDVTAVLDMGTQREANIRAQLPWTVFVVLMGLAVVGACMMGFAYPHAGNLRHVTSLFMFSLLTLAIIVIVDLDHPAGGGTRVDQGPMQQLVDALAATSVQSGPGAT